LLGLAFIEHKKTAPGPGGVVALYAQALHAEALGNGLKELLLLRVGSLHKKSKKK